MSKLFSVQNLTFKEICGYLSLMVCYTFQEANGHEGAKPQRVAFCGNLDFLFTCGFSRMSARQYAVWNAVSLM